MRANLNPKLEHLRADHEAAVMNALGSNVQSHQDPTDGFSLLEFDPIKYPFQRIDCRSVDGTNADANKLHQTAELVYPNAEQLIHYLRTDRKDLLIHAADRLDIDGKLKIITNHANVIGVMILGGVFMCAMYEEDLLDADDVDTALIVSDMIKRTGLHGIEPTVKTLSGLVSKTLFTLPQTDSIKDKEEIDDAVQREVNEVSREEYQEFEEAEKPTITFIAGSGKRDLFLPRKFGKNRHGRQFHMGPLSFGTAALMSTSWIVPGGHAVIEGEHYVFFGSMTPPTAEVEGDESSIPSHSVMQAIASGMQEKTGIEYIYHPSREDFAAIRK